MKNFFELIGRYFMLMSKAFSRPEKFSIYRKRILVEMASLGLNSIGIVAIISVFMGAVITIQMALNLQSPFIPKYLIGYATRESMLLEFSSTVVALILAGKVGSNIASEIGTMRITEQIDALEIMGVNSASYLILPKIIATVFFFPFLTIMSMGIGVAGGYVISLLTGAVNPEAYPPASATTSSRSTSPIHWSSRRSSPSSSPPFRVSTATTPTATRSKWAAPARKPWW